MYWKSFHPPRWIYVYFHHLGYVMWRFHDLILEPLIASGKTNKGITDPCPPRGNKKN
jgi:hypothetical protein